MTVISILAVLVALLYAPVKVAAQSVTLGAPLSVASAEDFATRTFQDPWDMNERTDFGWFLNGSGSFFEIDQCQRSASGPSNACNHIFTRQPGTAEHCSSGDGNPFCRKPRKNRAVCPHRRNAISIFAVRMRIDPTTSTQATLSWNRTNLYDGTFTTSNTFSE